MGIAVTITDGTNTVTLTTTDAYLQNYALSSSDSGTEPVTESLQVEFVGANNAAVEANLQKLERLLRNARLRLDGVTVDRVYFKVNKDGTIWQSEIYNGKIEFTEHWIKGERAVFVRNATLIITRAGWWEDENYSYLSVTNRHGSGTSGGIGVYNHRDSGHDNYVELGTIDGELPSPAMIRMDGSGMTNIEALCGVGHYMDWANFQHQWEGETATAGSGAVTMSILSDANCSNGSYAQFAFSGSDAKRMCYWTASGANLKACAGRVFWPVVRLRTAPSLNSYWFWLQVCYNNAGTLETIYEGEGVMAANQKVLILPPLRLPPWVVQTLTSVNAEIALHVDPVLTGSHTVQVDTLLLLPADSFLRLMPVVTTYPNFDLLFETDTRMLWSNSLSFASHYPEGPGIWLLPGYTNRIYFAFRAGTDWDIADNPTIRVQYRRRKRTI